MGVAGTGFAFEGRAFHDHFDLAGSNRLQLLGLDVDGRFHLAAGGGQAEASFDGLVSLGGSSLAVRGRASGDGSFSFTGDAQFALFGYRFSRGTVRFDNQGLFVSGWLDVAGQSVQLSGTIGAGGDFDLDGQGHVAIPIPGGFMLDTTVRLSKRGATVGVAGTGSVQFAGTTVNGGFRMFTSGAIDFDGSVAARYHAGDFSVEGDVRVRAGTSGLGAWFGYRACADLLVTDVCASGGAAVDSSGRVCVDVPSLGSKCFHIL
jgi:hypothetical protein